MQNQYKRKYLLTGLLEAWMWFDDALQRSLNASFTSSQSILFLRVGEGVTRQSEIARRMRLSKQAVRNIASDLIDMGYLTLIDDPTDGRSKMLVFTPKGVRLAKRAQQVIFDLEDLLSTRLNADELGAFRRVLESDWGETPTTRKELPRGPRKARNSPPLPVAKSIRK